MAKALSVRVLVPAAAILPAVIVAVLFGFIAEHQARRAADVLVGEIVAQISERVEARIDGLVQTTERLSRTHHAMMRRGVLDPADLRSWLAPLTESLRVYEELGGVAWGDASGRTVWLVRYPGEPGFEFGILDEQSGMQVAEYGVTDAGAIDAAPRGTYPSDPRQRPWYLAALRALQDGDEARWSEPYIWMRRDGGTEVPGVSYARPVLDPAGELLGVLDIELELGNLSSFLRGLRVGQTGIAFVIDGDGKLIASSLDQPLTAADANGTLTPILATNSSDELTRRAAALTLSIQNPAPLALLSPELLLLSDRLAWVAARRLSNRPGLDWRVIAVIPETDLTADVDRARIISLTVGGVATAGSLALGLLAAWWLTKPILTLRTHVDQMAGGDLTTTLKLDSASEFAELADDVNRMQQDLLDRVRMRESLQVAMEVQRALLPDKPPGVPGLDLAGESVYCDETGGDYYDFLDVTQVSPSGIALALGDVMGHGVAAALLMASARAVIRSRAAEVGSLAELMDHVNRQLVVDTAGMRFMTLMLALVDPASGLVRWCSAGQGTPMVLDPERGWLWTDLGDCGPPLGIDDSVRYEEVRSQVLRPGSIVLLGSDGVWEAMSPTKEQFGIDRVHDVIERLRDRPAADIAQGLREAVRRHRGQARVTDDITFVVARVVR